MNRVVITGMGAITPIGNDIETFWKNLIAGKNGIGKITHFDTEGFKATLAAEVKDFEPTDYIEKKEARKMDRFCQFALAAACQAMEQSGITAENTDPYRFGTIVGSGIGGMETFCDEFEKYFTKGPGRVSPFFIPTMISNMAAARISMRFGAKGDSYCPVTACSSGAHAIGEAFRLIRHGYADCMVAGGAEACIVPLAIAGFSNMHALNTSEDPDAASVPFDARRAGFVMGEGAGILVLESEEHAKARGAEILGELAGYGASSDAYHITSPDPSGEAACRAMQLAMADAGVTPEQVDYLNAHGTATPINDAFETNAVKLAFGEAAKGLHISSTKSMTGHLLGAAGGVEALVCALAVRDGIIPPTINYREPDPACDLDYTPNEALHTPVEVAMTNSLGFGGHNATIVVRAYR